MSTVWLVEEGEWCEEGGQVIGVFATEELALQFCVAEGYDSSSVYYVAVKEVQVIESLPAPKEGDEVTRGLVRSVTL